MSLSAYMHLMPWAIFTILTCFDNCALPINTWILNFCHPCSPTFNVVSSLGLQLPETMNPVLSGLILRRFNLIKWIFLWRSQAHLYSWKLHHESSVRHCHLCFVSRDKNLLRSLTCRLNKRGPKTVPCSLRNSLRHSYQPWFNDIDYHTLSSV